VERRSYLLSSKVERRRVVTHSIDLLSAQPRRCYLGLGILLPLYHLSSQVEKGRRAGVLIYLLSSQVEKRRRGVLSPLSASQRADKCVQVIESHLEVV
jgi:hypothetical protein